MIPKGGGALHGVVFSSAPKNNLVLEGCMSDMQYLMRCFKFVNARNGHVQIFH